MRGKVVQAREVRPGDRIILPVIGSRVVLEAGPSTFGIDEQPCIRIVYALGASLAYENRARAAKGSSAVTQPEAGLRPLLPEEPVALEVRGL